MSDEGDRACPLCAEEMDLTDQQLKPCKCGYEICVWCWHHIMDMAEKDQTQGRCPACRTPYNKEKVVSTAANCERLVAEMNMEKKMKSQKTKSKISDGRKQLGSVRVIQKSLVYIVGLPLTLADENLLQQRHYFGQYGRVLKVSVSRTAAGSIQQFPNNTCSVYITYSKEEEAVRCIQSVHGFVLEDRPLRACFGTTKYCHAWLRNVPCSIPDCLYLHEIASQEDSFTKDEIITAYTRVQQITGVTSNMQHRSGNVLPPPADDCHISSSTLSGKPTNQSASNNVATSVNGSMPNSSSGRSVALPSAASWGARASRGNPPSGNIACPNGPTKQKSEIFSGSASSAAFSAAVAGTVQVPTVHAETRKKLINNEESQNKPYKGGQEPVKSSRQVLCIDSDVAHDASVHISRGPSPNDKERYARTSPFETTSMESIGLSYNRGPENDLNVAAQGNNSKLSSDIKAMNITKLLEADHSGNNRPDSSLSVSADVTNLSLNQGLQQGHMLEVREPVVSISLGQTVSSANDSRVTKVKSGHRPEFLARRQPETESYFQAVGGKLDSQVASPRVRPHLQSLEGEKRNDSEMVSTSYFAAPPLPLHHSDLLSVHSPTHTEPYGSNSLIQDSPILDDTVDNGLLNPSGISTANAEPSVATDMRESHMISNILSLDFDPWEESLTSPQNLFKLLSEGDKHPRSLAPSCSWKAQNSNKSRFSFARPDECGDLPSNIGPSFSHMQQVFNESSLNRDFAVNRGSNFDKSGDCNGFSSFNNEEPDTLAGSYSYLSSSKFSGSRTQVSAPPGFSSPNKAPPPGFTSHERIGPNFNSVSGTHFQDTSSFLRNPYHPPQTERNGISTDMDASFLRNSYHSPQTENIGSSTDIEFMDPAILAVGKGRFPLGLNNGAVFDMSSNLSPQLNAIENDVRFQSSMQRSSPLVQNLRISGMGNGFGPVNETHNHLSSRIMEQTLASNLSPFSQRSLQQSRTSMMPNGQWNGWGEGKSDMGMAELLRTESFNKFYGGYEDSKFRMPSSGDIYNRTYGI